MRVSERGQITIPKKIRDQFGLKENTEVEFVVREGRVELRPSKKSRREKVDALYGRKAFKHSTEELMRLLRE
jgi:AbrB family looped-hinge helix DNA binding protein